jgi:hypothetical protein
MIGQRLNVSQAPLRSEVGALVHRTAQIRFRTNAVGLQFTVLPAGFHRSRAKADFPGCYVARMFEVGGGEVPKPTEVMLRAVGPNDGLKTLRDSFEAAGLQRMPRSAADGTELVESWV